MASIPEEDRAALTGILQQMEVAWNTSDGVAFGAPMAEDADFVTIRADHLKGRDAIVASHVRIFSTIYAGSHNQITLENARLLGADVALVHALAVLTTSSGPLRGRHEARFSLVLLRTGQTWRITSFHITLASEASHD